MNLQLYLSFRKRLLLGATLLLSVVAFAQVEQTARYEREHKVNDPELLLVPMGDKGIVIINDKDKYNEGKKLWGITALSTDLDETWNLELETESRHRLVAYEYKDNLIFLLYRINDHEGSDLNLVTIHLETQEIKRYKIKQELTFKITHFGVLSRAIVLGGYVNQDPAVLVYDLASENLKIVPGFFVTDTELLDLRMNANNTFNTLTVDRNTKEKKKLMLKTFDASGAMLFDDNIEIEANRSILSGITSTLVNDELLITGTWTEGVSKQASGIYSVMADPFSDQKINFYDFGSLQNFLEYQTSSKRAAKLKEKSKEAKASGIVPDFKTYTSVIRMEEQPGVYAVLAEVYQPTSNFNSTSYLAGYSNPYSYGGYNPFGYGYGYNSFMNRYYNPTYQYNNAPALVSEAKMMYSSVLLFDLQGRLTHDYGLVLKEKKIKGLEQTADFVINDNENAAIAYKKEKELYVIRHNPDGSRLDTLQNTLKKQEEVVRSDSDNGNVRFWYQNFMYSWGYQQIKDQEKKSEDPNRYVFYINKIRID
jgi:hypothetical protein